MNKFLAAGITLALAGGMAFTAVAQSDSAKTEITIAHQHAVMAQHAGTLKMVTTHLHHVINCLVGPDGKAFDASAGNPCKGKGDGAIEDTKGNADLHDTLQNALSAAKAGVAADSLSAAQSDAAKAAAALKLTSTTDAGGGYGG